MRWLRDLAIASIVLVACLIAGFVVAGLLSDPDFQSVDLAAPPIDLAVLGLWEEPGVGLICRAFYRRDLLSGDGSLPDMRHAASDEELSNCQESFLRFNREGRWGSEFEWDFRGYYAWVEKPDPNDPALHVVSYWSDVDRMADTRYRATPSDSALPTSFEFRGGFGPALGLGIVVFGGGGGILLWMLWLMVVLWRRLSGRRGARSSVG